jgi:NADH-quinone oxidoreductase subunit J
MHDRLLITCEIAAILSAAGIIFSRSVFISVMLFLVCCLSIAGIFGVLNAPFLLIAQIAVYGGGIAVLFLFAVMLSGKSEITSATRLKLAGIIPPIVLFWFLSRHAETLTTKPSTSPEFTAGYTGSMIANDFIFPFELSGVLLLVSLVAAIFISVQKPEK